LRTDGFSMITWRPAWIAFFAASKWRSSGEATQTKSTPDAIIFSTLSAPSKLVKSAILLPASFLYARARDPVRVATAASETPTNPKSFR
jgi:hypothetical protein